MENLVEEVIRQKASAMLGADNYRQYARQFADEIGGRVSHMEKVFLAGAIDAMAFDVSAMINPKRLPGYEERKRLIKDILSL